MSTSPPARYRISVSSVADRDTPMGKRLYRLAPVIDRILGINALDAFYQRHDLNGLPPHRFACDTLDNLGVTVRGAERIAEQIPEAGPVIVVANHPHGGIEGLVMVKLLAALRPDLKIMANLALSVFKELAPKFLFVNPLNARDPANSRGLRESRRHLENGGVLVMFPAGRTSFYQDDLGIIADSDWSRAAATLAKKTGAEVLPVRFTGKNSPLFYRLGSIWYRFRLLLLARELMKTRGQNIDMVIGRRFDPELFKTLEPAALTDVFRLSCTTLQAPAATGVAESTPAAKQQALMAPVERRTLEDEIAALPSEQRVVATRGFVVGFGSSEQLPSVLAEITRERERTFRLLDEGSGNARDSDEFDANFDQLFCWDETSRSLVGAYRIGRRDHVLDTCGSYLDNVFAFSPHFFTDRAPALELGRSFVTPEFQRSRHALDLLWRGIGGYLRAHPEYGTLYGTVSLTRQYDPVSIAMICDTLITASDDVTARHALASVLGPEWQRFKQQHDVDLSLLNALVVAREADGKGLPVLLRHYAALRAEFHAVGVDPNFAQTPGLLLSVNLATLPAAKRKRYIDTDRK